jgi:hypothetical protein
LPMYIYIYIFVYMYIHTHYIIICPEIIWPFLISPLDAENDIASCGWHPPFSF